MEEQCAGRHRQHTAATGRQHHPGCRQHQSITTTTPNYLAAVNSSVSVDRSHYDHTRFGQGRSVLPVADSGARSSVIFYSYENVRNDHSERAVPLS